jgi:4-amino-4-deoxy-L-arabinose transferase-like glycosyltransferase
MPQNIRYQIWIALAAGVIFFTCLGTAGLWDEDETLYAACAREMMERGDWVVPMFNGHLFPDKPPLMYWTMMAGFKIFGENEFGARFFSAVLGIATAILTYHLGRKLFGERVGFWAGIVTASSIIFTVSARAATVDAALVFVTTAAVWCFVMAREGIGVQGSGFRRFLYFVAFYVFLGLAVLAKGPVGFLLPMASLGLFLMIENYRPKAAVANGEGKRSRIVRFFANLPGFVYRVAISFFASLWQLRPLTGLVVVSAVALPWYFLVDARTNHEWTNLFFNKFNLRPFTQPILGHSGPFWYYVPGILIGFFPWSVFLGPACIDIYRRLRSDDPRRGGLKLLLCLFGGWFVFWSICSTKLPHYLLPVYPALAMLTAVFLEGWIAQRARVGQGWMRSAWTSTIAVGVGMTIALPIVAFFLLPGEEWIGTVGSILALGGFLAWRQMAKGKRFEAVRTYGIASVAFLTAAFGFVAIGVDRHQNARPMLAEIRRDCPESADICEYGFHRQSTVYYAGHPIAIHNDPAGLKTFLDSAGRAYIITLDEYRAEIEKNFPGQFEVLHRNRRFLANGEMIVLKRAGASASERIGVKPDAKHVQ